MTRRALLLVLGVALALGTTACKKGSKRLEGTWKGTRTDGVTTEAQSTADRWASQLQMDFKGESLTITTGAAASSSRYHVVREDKGSIVIVTDADGTEETLAFENETTMKWTVQPGKTVTLAKQ
jgi:hypothetical protein